MALRKPLDVNAIREAKAYWVKRGLRFIGWYRQEHETCKDIARELDVTVTQAAYAAAILSPLKEWEQVWPLVRMARHNPERFGHFGAFWTPATKILSGDVHDPALHLRHKPKVANFGRLLVTGPVDRLTLQSWGKMQDRNGRRDYVTTTVTGSERYAYVIDTWEERQMGVTVTPRNYYALADICIELALDLDLLPCEAQEAGWGAIRAASR